MKRALIRSSAFIRAAKKLLRKNPTSLIDLKTALLSMEENIFNSSLKSHKLSGDLSGSWACSASYNLRIIFSIVNSEGKEAILLETIGTHDEVY